MSSTRTARASVALALHGALLDDLVARVPSAARYLARCRDRGREPVIDHGALRTVDGPTGALPSGADAFRRLLLPLGYEEVGLYPLDRLGMTGRVFCHADDPQTVPQFFVSELHVDRLAPEAQAAVERVTGRSRDPLGDGPRRLLDRLDAGTPLGESAVAGLVRALVGCFGRHHDDPPLDDYELLVAHSAEMAWIATEGNAFNHATDRVEGELESLMHELRGEGFRVKDEIEHSRSGRVHQTALRADEVVRRFATPDGATVERRVPGSFFEFIVRDRMPDGRLDLTFDAGNAQGIFTMTRSTGRSPSNVGGLSPSQGG